MSKKPKVKLKVVKKRAKGVEIDVEFDYGWVGRLNIPYTTKEMIEEAIKNVYESNKPSNKEIKLDEEMDW